MARLVLLIESDPWHRVFFRNLADVLLPQRRASLYLSSPPGEFWADVFVERRLPWRKLAESALYHLLLIVGFVGLHRYLPHQPTVIAQSVFSHSDVVYYQPSEYLPPLDTGGTRPQITERSDPEYASQPIISVPPEPDNRKQTIVVPPNVKLQHDVSLPNIVEWSEAALPAVPMAATTRSAHLSMPTLPSSVVAPAPQIDAVRNRAGTGFAQEVVAPAPQLDLALSRQKLTGPQGDAVAPAPVLQSTLTRRVGDVNIGHAAAVAPAPQLALAEQHTIGANRPGLGGGGTTAIVPPPPSISGVGRAARPGSGGNGSTRAAVVPPPPAISGAGGIGGGGRLIALGLHPSPPTAPVQPPAGNRRGSFAATPQGKSGASGTPGAAAGGQGTGGRSGDRSGSVPSGIFVGAGPSQSNTAGPGLGTGNGPPENSSNAVLTAKNSTPRVGSAQSASTLENPSPLERQVFAGRRSYSMTLNMPNLNSAGGSWVIHFAELKDYGKGELLPPVATKKVDPGYPLELIRRNVQGTVTLRAVIHSDGSVSDIKVLQGVDDRLDQYACDALSRWKFIPAEKNGTKVALDAVVMIPFRTGRLKSSF